MSTVRDLHERAMQLAQSAIVSRHNGNESDAEKLARQAYELEKQAADLIPEGSGSEPTRSILYRSAASLAYQAREYDIAIGLVEKGLSGFPPKQVKQELNDLLGSIRGSRSQNKLIDNTPPQSMDIAPHQSRSSHYLQFNFSEGRIAVQELSGRTIRDYIFGDLISEGGNGMVYLARQASVDREVAIKMILPEHANKPDFTERFTAEARTIAKLEHPHIVPLYDYWQDDDGAFLVMRYIKAGSLRNVLSNHGAVALSQVIRLIDQIADALDTAHQAGVIHRDIKPENILLDERGNAYLTDFGIAKQFLRVATDGERVITAPNTIVGTPAYLSPEQIMEVAVTPQTDIYALGVMLYEMLTGKHPFPDASLALVITHHLRDPLPSLLTLRPDLPPALDSVITKATEKEAANRYSSTLLFAETLHTHLVPKLDPTFHLLATPVFTPSAPPVMKTQEQTQKFRNANLTPERNRFRMLQNVRAYWIKGVLENTIHGATLIELGIRQVDNMVDNPWDLLLKVPSSPAKTLPPDTQIIRVFDQLNGKLLILGDPGSGKTTSLLELTRDLLFRAEADNEHPIPVVFNLSSWAEKQKPIVEWLVDELNNKYQVPKLFAQEWVERDNLLLLLDGLDEVAAPLRNNCVQALNIYRESHGFVDIVVCSRTQDYESLTHHLKLNGSIVLKPLNDGQIDTYLARLGPDMNTLYSLLQDDTALRELSRSPLILNVLTVAYQDVTPESLQGFKGTKAQRQHLFDVYVKRMFERHIIKKSYTAKQTTHYLSWLARQMIEQAQTVFQIENLQPAWLTGEPQKRYVTRYQRSIVLVYALFSFFLGIIYVPFTLQRGRELNTPFEDIVLIIGIPLLFTAQAVAIGWLVATERWLRRRWTFLIGLILVIWLASIYALTGVPAERLLVSALFFGVSGGMLYYYLARLVIDTSDHSHRIVLKETTRWSLSKARSNLAPILTLCIIGIIFLPLYHFTLNRNDTPLVQLLLSMVLSGIAFAVMGILYFGLTFGEVEMRVRPNQSIWRSLANANRVFLFSSLALLVISIAITSISSLINGAMIALGGVALSFVIIWLTYGGFTFLKHVVLRRTLYHYDFTPHNYAHFLDFAATIVLLRKVGGGYIFIHRYLVEYFSDLNEIDS